MDGDGSREIEVIPEVLEAAPARPALPRWWRQRSRWQVVAGAVALMLVGGLIVGGGYYASVERVELSPLPAGSTLYYRDGTVLGHVGPIKRRKVAYADLLPFVTQAAVAAEDRGFWSNTAGPITRSAVRLSLGFEPRGRRERVELAVQAAKLEDSYSKDEILAYWLNGTPFGRMSYGIEGAAETYLGKSARRSAPPERQLTPGETIALLAMVDQPEANPDDPEGSPGFDPVRSELAARNSRRRWAEIRDAMVSAGSLTRADAEALLYPIAWRPYGSDDEFGPAGLVINQVLSELDADRSPFAGRAWSEIAQGGYDIVTTIDPWAQQALEHTADMRVANSAMYGQPDALQAAAVVIEPGTGRVLAYFGGSDGRGADFAGVYRDDKKEWSGFGAHPPGGTFLVHTLAAALKAGVSLRSYWQSTPHDQPGRPSGNQIRDTGACPVDQSSRGACTLAGATLASLNVPFYDVTVSVSPAKVLELARDAGIDAMWTDDRVRQDLGAAANLVQFTPSKFDLIVGLGQYPVTVLDQANAMATYAAGGARAPAHFVSQVRRADKVVYPETLPRPNSPRVLTSDQVADLDWVLSQSGRAAGIDAALKTGAWRFDTRVDLSSDAWAVGYTGSLAMAVWVGAKRGDQPLTDNNGATVWGSGLPTRIFQDFMSTAHEALGLHPAPFPPPVFAGRADPPGSVSR